MKKKLRTILFCLILLSLFTGCSGGSYSITAGDITSFQNEIKGDYSRFSGKYYSKITLKEEENAEVTFTARTEKGNIKAVVLNSDGNEVESLKPGDTVQIGEPGKYKLQVEGEKHKGNFILSWETN